MGLDRLKKTPCGFCFVEFFDRADAETAVRFLNGAKLDDRQIRTDWDWGFDDGRQYGRGKSGGQVNTALLGGGGGGGGQVNTTLLGGGGGGGGVKFHNLKTRFTIKISLHQNLPVLM